MQWLCKCDCGNEKVIDQALLISGSTNSCGCLNKERGALRRKDLTGQRFGRLVVIEYAGSRVTPNGTHKSLWKCRCDCGKETVIQGDDLKCGTSQSCGCLKLERTTELFLKPLDGQRFGKLVVINRVENDRFNHVRYLCKCDCGGITIVDAGNLRRGLTSSCGCIKSKGESIVNNWLVSHSINFIPQYSLDDVFFSSGRRPFFDFGIFDDDWNFRFLIEYNGIQHYEPTFGWNTEEKYLENARRDQEKIQQCRQKNYDIVVIPYWDLDNIDELLSTTFQSFGFNSENCLWLSKADGGK